MSNSRLKSFIDRILRLKEEEDAIKADIREVYAEMKGEGYDKTAAGQLVSYLRKVEKKGRDEVDNANAIFDLYLNEYENGTALATRAHTHEKSPSSADLPLSSDMADDESLTGQVTSTGEAPLSGQD